MTTKEINEGNKLIAEFIGGEKIYADVELISVGTIAYPLNKLEYHSSWDWLMPVVEKIESLPPAKKHIHFVVTIESNSCTITSIGEGDPLVIDSLAVNKIEATWIAVIHFIRSYDARKN